MILLKNTPNPVMRWLRLRLSDIKSEI